ncbi:unnamed protein product [Cylicocyclus nassatus]|uniref:Uncharacterized protein n=1 Tax=Cylicocyclus nassatus TaxID=53992 RepID=A0AA36GSU6_CYLNA|nr:unnamed protein product [Cylicocyclus nassatus]
MSTYEALDLRYDATIGYGSFGRVDLACSKTAQQYYAVKKFNIHEIVQQAQNEYINNERRILQSLEHPFLVKLICTHMDRVNLYLVMECVEGGEVRDYLIDMSEEDLCNAVRFYSVEVICAFRYMHSKNIVYRDLKPENLLLSKDGHVKLSDFGLAKVLKGKTYTICGTAEYLAPEILLKKGYNAEVDWWSLGTLVYELISGSPPFCGINDEETFDLIKKGDLQIPSKFHEEMREVVETLLNRDPSKRSSATSLKWYADIDFTKVENKAIEPPFVPAPFAIEELPKLEQDKGEPAMQRERDLFEDW